MSISDVFNSVNNKFSGAVKSIKDAFGPVTYHVQEEPKPYVLPKVIAPEHHNTFIQEANKVGLTPEEFGMIAKREQGSTTLPHQAALIGGVDPKDKGVMQVNKVNEPIVKTRFKKELGLNYNPFDAQHSIIAARMVLEENKRQLDQMVKNGTIPSYTNQDLVDSYNLGATGLAKAKQGNKAKANRLLRYQGAGQ